MLGCRSFRIERNSRSNRFIAEPETAWLRLKTRARKPRELAVLIEVAAWREQEAQQNTENQPERVLRSRSSRDTECAAKRENQGGDEVEAEACGLL